MSKLINKVVRAINVLRDYEPEEGYYLCYSGGKDSDVIRILATLANVKHDIHHNLTTVDAPETIAYIKSVPNVIIEKAHYTNKFDRNGNPLHMTMWNLILHKGLPPTRLMRYCCEYLKEGGGKGRLKITGVRAAESAARKQNGGEIKVLGKPKTTEKYMIENEVDYTKTPKGGIILNFDDAYSRRAVEHCYRTTSTMINPILDWTNDDVFEFLRYYNNGFCNPLYSRGCSRVGCIGCPMNTKAKQEFEIYPKYKEQYIRTFDHMLDIWAEKRNYKWKSGEEVFDWWIARR